MARKADEYVVGILGEYKGIRTIEYVTKVGDSHTAYWQKGKEAKVFSKAYAIDMCKGFAFNGIAAIPILKQDYISYVNPEEDESDISEEGK